MAGYYNVKHVMLYAFLPAKYHKNWSTVVFLGMKDKFVKLRKSGLISKSIK